MKLSMIFSIVTVATALGLHPANAHEGHDKTPGSLAAPHGGIIKGSEHIYLELVTEKSGLKLYPFDHDMKPIPTKDVKVEGKMSIPRKPKSETLKIAAEGDHFKVTVDSKGAHRYDLDLSITHQAKTDKVKFSVEPL